MINIQQNIPCLLTYICIYPSPSPAIFLDEKDMSRLVITAVEDPRTLDKVLYVRPPANVCSFAQLVHLIEKKTGRALERQYVSELELTKKIQGNIHTHYG
jgi:hypothetical protein